MKRRRRKMTDRQFRERVETITRRAMALLNAGRIVTPGYAEVCVMAGQVNPFALQTCTCCDRKRMAPRG